MSEQTGDSAAERNGLLSTVAALSDGASARMRRIMAAYLVGHGLFRITRSWAVKIRTETSYTISIQGDDDLYPDVHRWLLEQLPAAQRRGISVRTARSSEHEGAGVPDAGARPTPAMLRLYFDGTRAQTVLVDRHKVRVEVERPNFGGRAWDQERPNGWDAGYYRIVFTIRTEAGRDALLQVLRGIADQHYRSDPRVLIADRWGGWSRRSGNVGRPLESVVLRAGQRDALVDDLLQFLRTEADYVRLGVPWHRGYLFEGPPGTGKTSISRALATHLELDVYYIPLPAVPNDGAFFQLLAAVEPRSMLLLEDIDVVHGSKVRDDSEPGVSLSGLLNGLDGLVTPHGLVTVMTTNDASVLDPALVRPGRVDRIERFVDLDDRQLQELASVFLRRPVDLPPLGGSVSPARAIEAIKRHIGDDEAAVVALKRLVTTGADRA